MVEVRQAHDGRLADVEIHVVEDDAVIRIHADAARVERPVLLERIARGKDAALHEVAVATGVVLEGISREEVGEMIAIHRDAHDVLRLKIVHGALGGHELAVAVDAHISRGDHVARGRVVLRLVGKDRRGAVRELDIARGDGDRARGAEVLRGDVNRHVAELPRRIGIPEQRLRCPVRAGAEHGEGEGEGAEFHCGTGDAIGSAVRVASPRMECEGQSVGQIHPARML